MTRAPRPRLPLFTGRSVSREELAAAANPTELSLHFATVKILRTAVPSTWIWTHFPAGELRDARTAGKLKNMGVKPGWPDFLLVSPSTEYRGARLHCLELKRRRGGRLSPDQEGFATWAEENRLAYAVADTLDGVMAALRGWGALR